MSGMHGNRIGHGSRMPFLRLSLFAARHQSVAVRRRGGHVYLCQGPRHHHLRGVMFGAATVFASVFSMVPAAAADGPFMITYHVERTSANALNPDDGTTFIGGLAQEAGDRIVASRHEGQLAVISSGPQAAPSSRVASRRRQDRQHDSVAGLQFRQGSGRRLCRPFPQGVG